MERIRRMVAGERLRDGETITGTIIGDEFVKLGMVKDIRVIRGNIVTWETVKITFIDLIEPENN